MSYNQPTVPAHSSGSHKQIANLRFKSPTTHHPADAAGEKLQDAAQVGRLIECLDIAHASYRRSPVEACSLTKLKVRNMVQWVQAGHLTPAHYLAVCPLEVTTLLLPGPPPPHLLWPSSPPGLMPGSHLPLPVPSRLPNLYPLHP